MVDTCTVLAAYSAAHPCYACCLCLSCSLSVGVLLLVTEAVALGIATVTTTKPRNEVRGRHLHVSLQVMLKPQRQWSHARHGTLWTTYTPRLPTSSGAGPSLDTETAATPKRLISHKMCLILICTSRLIFHIFRVFGTVVSKRKTNQVFFLGSFQPSLRSSANCPCKM